MIVVAPALILLVYDEAQLDYAVDAPANRVGTTRLKPEVRKEASKSSLIRSFTGVGSSRLKPEVSKEVSKSSLIRSFTVLSD